MSFPAYWPHMHSVFFDVEMGQGQSQLHPSPLTVPHHQDSMCIDHASYNVQLLFQDSVPGMYA